MLKRIQNPRSAFDRYFREADDDDNSVSVTVSPRKNRGTDYTDDAVIDSTKSVTVKPRGNSGTDYSKMADDEESSGDTETTDTSSDETTVSEPDTGDEGTDYTASDDSGETGDEETTSDDSEDTADADEPDTGDEGTDYTASDESGETGDESGNDTSEPDTGDGGTDYTDDEASSGEEGESDSENTDSSDSQSGDSSNPESSDDKVKKYNMYTRYLHLYNNINSMLEKLKDVVKNDVAENAVIKTVTNNLISLKNNMYDFMILKYKTASYMEILIYFETSINCIRLNFELLRNNKIKLKQ